MKYVIASLITLFLLGCGSQPKPSTTKSPQSAQYKPHYEELVENDPIETLMKNKSINSVEVQSINSKDERIILVDTSKYIYFDIGKYTVRNTSKLKQFIKKFKEDEQLYFYIVGHTDSAGTDIYNQWLSEMRAREVYKIFLKFGFDTSRVDYIGYGEEQPIRTNSTRHGRAHNRRVELLISNQPNLATKFLKNRVIDIKFLNNHDNINPGQVEVSIKGLTKNKSEKELQELQVTIKTPKRKSFDINITKRKHFISF